ncbi:MAG: CoA:oxalate CoA-transferase [Thermosediminibacterales bacterium]|nr:CoA:oxalate CoA-transferase [Thermosediminibacterales bacterium]MDK2836112.1 CoA:oxalate CoA-transferase [Thermosediminibacterales bacterium]
MRQPLNGVKVIDLTRVLAGPYATMILADLGAEVIKVEMPGRGDDSRAFGPYIKDESVYFMSLNRNKKSITLNLKAEKGKQIFRELVKKADVVVENFRPGVMEKLGFGYEALKSLNPGIIYAACSGFGHTGPYSEKPAYDAIVQALGGIMSITGNPGGKPTRVGASIGDIIAGMFTSIGILAALNRRNKTGEGEKIDVAMLDCQVAILENAIARYFVEGEIPKPIGNRHPSITPFETFEAEDGDIMVAVGNDNLWVKYCKTIGREDLIEDKRFQTNVLRNKNYKVLRPILAEVMKTKKVEDWIRIFDKNGIPSAPINTIDKVVKDPQILARKMIVETEHPKAGKLKIPGVPIKFTNSSAEVRAPAPLLGQHLIEVLKDWVGLTEEDIDKLKSEGVV